MMIACQLTHYIRSCVGNVHTLPGSPIIVTSLEICSVGAGSFVDPGPADDENGTFPLEPVVGWFLFFSFSLVKEH